MYALSQLLSYHLSRECRFHFHCQCPCLQIQMCLSRKIPLSVFFLRVSLCNPLIISYLNAPSGCLEGTSSLQGMVIPISRPILMDRDDTTTCENNVNPNPDNSSVSQNPLVLPPSGAPTFAPTFTPSDLLPDLMKAPTKAGKKAVKLRPGPAHTVR